MINWPSEPTSECVSGGSPKAKQENAAFMRGPCNQAASRPSIKGARLESAASRWHSACVRRLKRSAGSSASTCRSSDAFVSWGRIPSRFVRTAPRHRVPNRWCASSHGGSSCANLYGSCDAGIHRTRSGERSGAQPLAGALRTCAQGSVALPAFMAHCGGVVLQPASQKRPDSVLRTANSVRALSFVSALLSSVGSISSSCCFSPLDQHRLDRGFKAASRPSRLRISARCSRQRVSSCENRDFSCASAALTGFSRLLKKSAAFADEA